MTHMITSGQLDQVKPKCLFEGSRRSQHIHNFYLYIFLVGRGLLHQHLLKEF